MAWKTLYLAIIFIISVTIASAAPENYKTTYTINLKENGSAIWNVEYRTLLTTKEDFNSFDNYSQQLKSIYLPEFNELMQRSASEASAATSRSMAARDFAGDTLIQSTPTGKYGIVHYSFIWTNFSKSDSNLNIGDVFIGGLYLNKDSTLIIQYPPDFTVEEATPKPDQSRGEVIWYGLRSFDAGEPRIILTKPTFPWITASIVVLIIAAGTIIIAFIIKRRKQDFNDTEVQQNIEITEIEIMDVEERILKLLKEGGGALYQSEIGRQLGLPKSSVSAALNELHARKLIQKIKKGRENLIRLISPG
jgi:uncharacterized membrane protein